MKYKKGGKIMTLNSKTEMREILKILSRVSLEDKIKLRDYLKALSSESIQKEVVANG